MKRFNFLFTLGRVFKAYLVEYDLVDHSINSRDNTEWNQDDKDEAEHLVIFTHDGVIKAFLDWSVLMPSKRKETHDESKKPGTNNFSIYAAFVVTVF